MREMAVRSGHTRRALRFGWIVCLITLTTPAMAGETDKDPPWRFSDGDGFCLIQTVLMSGDPPKATTRLSILYTDIEELSVECSTPPAQRRLSVVIESPRYIVADGSHALLASDSLC